MAWRGREHPTWGTPFPGSSTSLGLLFSTEKQATCVWLATRSQHGWRGPQRPAHREMGPQG